MKCTIALIGLIIILITTTAYISPSWGKPINAVWIPIGIAGFILFGFGIRGSIKEKQQETNKEKKEEEIR